MAENDLRNRQAISNTNILVRNIKAKYLSESIKMTEDEKILTDMAMNNTYKDYFKKFYMTFINGQFNGYEIRQDIFYKKMRNIDDDIQQIKY